MVIGYLKSTGTGNMNNYIMAGVGVLLVTITWLVQDWRYTSKIAIIETAHIEEKVVMTNEANLRLIAEQEKSRQLSQELIDAKNKNSGTRRRNEVKIDEFSKNNPATHKFDDDWVRIYNKALSNSAE